jgi:RNA polymerase sigma factor (sigma-70 family)
MHDLEPIEDIPPKDLLVKIRLQNNRIWSLVRSKWGNITQAELGRKAGLHPTQVGAILNFRSTIVTKSATYRGTQNNPVIGYSGLYWVATVTRLADALDVPPECIFPEEFWGPKQNMYELEISTDEALALTQVHHLSKSPEDLLLEAESKRLLNSALGGLEDRYQYVLRNRYGMDGVGDKPLTLTQIAKKMDVTRERVRQIELRGIEKLKFAFYREQTKAGVQLSRTELDKLLPADKEKEDSYMSQTEEVSALRKEVKQLKRQLKEEAYKTMALKLDVKEINQRLEQLVGHRHSYESRLSASQWTGVNQKMWDHTLPSPYKPRPVRS